MFTLQQEIGTRREEAAKTEEHPEVPLERARSEDVPKGKTKAQGDITLVFKMSVPWTWTGSLSPQ